MKSKGSGFFWPSFTDLMTSLFFIMLVLYVLTYLKLTHQQQVTEQQLNKIREIQAAVKELPRQYFAYDERHKRFSLVQNVQFEKYDDKINPYDEAYLINVGNSIRNLIDTLKRKYSGQDIRYLVIIEGMASNDYYRDNYPLSYNRAWAVLKLWERNNIMPDASVCEVQVSGSGTGGVGRFPASEETRNQRILIQIVPKIGRVIN